MEKTLLVGDHLLVDRITLAPPTNGCRWFTIASRSAATLSSLKNPSRTMLTENPNISPCQALIGVPGDHIRLRNVHRHPQWRGARPAQGGIALHPTTRSSSTNFLRAARSRTWQPDPESWAVEFPVTLKMGIWWCLRKVLHDGRSPARQRDFDSGGFVPRENIVGRGRYSLLVIQGP